MDERELQQQLDEWHVTPPDVLRSALYLTELTNTRTFLFTGIKNDPVIGPVYARFATALQDPSLLDHFCEILDDFLAPAVSVDLQNPPQAYTTYTNYFDVNIFNANGGNFPQNVLNFYGRYLATDRAMAALTANFQNNILTACQRIEENWDDLNKTFCALNEQLVRLIGIQSTGSDFHKGGQQVLILTFDLFVVITDNMGDTSPMGGTLRVVYKPSDLEADCLIAGNSAAVNAVHANFQAASLFEILNTLIEAEKETKPRLQTLPTYKILPYNYGSSLHAVGGALPIRTSYGYVQFLEHKHAPGRNIWNYYPFGESDFKIFPTQDAVAISKQFYQQAGELVAVASSFSILDMHIENVIVSRYQCNLIDLEISVTLPVVNAKTTSLFDGQGGITGQNVVGVDYTWVVGGNAGHLHLGQKFTAPEKQNRLWTMSPDNVVNPSAPAPANALMTGFRDGLEIIQDGVNAAANVFNAWFNRLTDVVVRYLPYGTPIFQAAMADIYGELHVADLNFYQQQILEMVSIGYHDYQLNPTPEPNFVAVQEIYTGTAYQNCDIPTFYHRINTRDIMDDSGQTVAIPANVTILNDHPPPATVLAPVALARGTYFANLPTTTNVQTNQVDFLGAGANFNTRFNQLRPTVVAGLGLQAVPAISTVIH